jgi:hypothetical protein
MKTLLAHIDRACMGVTHAACPLAVRIIDGYQLAWREHFQEFPVKKHHSLLLHGRRVISRRFVQFMRAI